MKDRMTNGRRLDAPIRRRMAVQKVIPELLADRTPVLECRVDRLIRPAEHLNRSESRLCAALRRNIDERSRLIAHIRFHTTEYNVGPLPSSG